MEWKEDSVSKNFVLTFLKVKLFVSSMNLIGQFLQNQWAKLVKVQLSSLGKEYSLSKVAQMFRKHVHDTI